MFKQVFTLFRGIAHNAAEDFTDQHALPILQQQIREAAHSIEVARKAVAVAIAQNEQEKRQCDMLQSQISDLESRAIDALEQEKASLAQEAAETIAALESELASREASLESITAEVERLRANVRQAELRLIELKRGQHIANATDKAQRLREEVPHSTHSTLNDAEATLSRLRERQSQIDATDAALQSLNTTDNPISMSEKLAEAGCGPALKTTADNVLDRLRKHSSKSK